MLAILDAVLGAIPRAVLIAAILALGGYSAVLKYDNLTLETDLSKEQTHVSVLETYIAQANSEHATQLATAERDARKAEQDAADRARELAAAADNARGQLAGLRDALQKARGNTLSVPSHGGIPKADYTDTLTELLISCSGRYILVAQAADGHANDVKTLTEAWPKP